MSLINENQLINKYMHDLSVAALQMFRAANLSVISSSVWDKLQSDQFSEVFYCHMVNFECTRNQLLVIQNLQYDNTLSKMYKCHVCL